MSCHCERSPSVNIAATPAVRAPAPCRRAGASDRAGIGEVAVLNQVAQYARCAGVHVAAEGGLRANQPENADKLIRAHLVSLYHFTPVGVGPERVLAARADAVLTVITIRETAAGPAHDRGIKPA